MNLRTRNSKLDQSAARRSITQALKYCEMAGLFLALIYCCRDLRCTLLSLQTTYQDLRTRWLCTNIYQISNIYYQNHHVHVSVHTQWRVHAFTCRGRSAIGSIWDSTQINGSMPNILYYSSIYPFCMTVIICVTHSFHYLCFKRGFSKHRKVGVMILNWNYC